MEPTSTTPHGPLTTDGRSDETRDGYAYNPHNTLATTTSGGSFSPVVHANINTVGQVTQVSKTNASVTASNTHSSQFDLRSLVDPKVAPLRAIDLKSIIDVEPLTVGISSTVDHTLSYLLSPLGSSHLFSEMVPGQTDLFQHGPTVPK